ncbi:MAG: alpha/beta hydrolase [Myxococcales bacterium]|nr:alpha/beta hydrolase [Myxococcales bacterium]
MRARLCLAASLVLVLAACGDDGATPPAPDLSVEAAGPYPVGTVDVTLTDGARARDLPTQVWFPAEAGAAAAAATGFPIAELELEPNRTTYADLLAAADPACPSRTAHAARGAAPAPGRFPLIAISHCHECTRFSTATVAERLASHGFVVVAVDHVGNTLWNQQAGDGLPLDTTTLATRVADVRLAIDAALAGTPPFPAALTAVIDPETIGVMGHSFGAVTAGMVTQAEPRIDAALALAAPMENPLLPGVHVADLGRPLGFVLAVEDNSITELGNNLIRSNYDQATAGAWRAEIADAGHWSVSDLVGVIPGFAPGCQAGTRQTDGQPFTYLDAATGRAITAAYATAFFRAYLADDAGARAYLDAPRPAGTVTVTRR